MNKSKAAWFLAATTVLLVVPFAGSAFAGPATEAIQQTHEAVLLVLHDKELSRPERTAERQHELIRVIGQRFNYRAMGRHILGLQWPLLRDDERAEFIELFRLLLLKTYAHYLDGAKDQRLHYLDEQVDQGHALVRTKLVTPHRELPIDFSVFENAGGWQIYDVAVEGISLIQSYRSQFKRLLRFSSYTSLVEKLREKVCHAECDGWRVHAIR